MQFIKDRFSISRRLENNSESHHLQTDPTTAKIQDVAASQRVTRSPNQETVPSPNDLARTADLSVPLPPGIEGQNANELEGYDSATIKIAPDISNELPPASTSTADPTDGSFSNQTKDQSEPYQSSYRNLVVKASTPRNSSPNSRFAHMFENLRRSQHNLPPTPDNLPRIPTKADFLPHISMTIYPDDLNDPVDDPVEHIIIYLHQFGGDEKSLGRLARKLRGKLPRSAYILLRGIEPVSPGHNGYSWADLPSQRNEGFLNINQSLLVDVIQNGLISRCNFKPKNIMVLGHCQGGMAALATVATWDQVEFGGVISIGGPLPTYVQLPVAVKAKTPALILRAALGDVHPSALQRIRETFENVDSETRPGAHDTIPEKLEELRPILDFFAHRFHREEWNKQAIVSFDGGGIRGLGSLLILQELMNKIGEEEKRIDREDGCAESSFAPCLFKPTTPRRILTTSTGNSEDVPIATALDGLPNSSLFLPCHYFTYAAGTSTGGLISIMLSRFRMTVDDCIEEYKTLGERIFGHPRPLAKGAILWHKFSAKTFEEVIRDVTARHSSCGEFAPIYPSDEDLCRTLVFAYADHLGSDVPYFFRTYFSPQPTPGPARTSSRREITENRGEPPELPIWQVARATSAAPGYFSPIKIPKGNSHDTRQYIRFKDGGFGTNNPSREAYYDIVNRHGGSRSIGLFISIGTGETPLSMFATKPGNIRNAITNLKTAIRLPARTLRAHHDMARLAFHDNEEFFSYYRFQGGKALGEVALDEWKSHKLTILTGQDSERGCKTVKKINLRTAAYLQNRDVQRDLIACAKILVRRRRLRTRDVSQWDKYASASYYECSYKGCERNRIQTHQLYKEHVKDKHHFQVRDQVIEKQMQESRRCWIYPNQSATPSPSGPDNPNNEDSPNEPAVASSAIDVTEGTDRSLLLK